MAGKNTAVFGIYPTYADVEEGVEALKAAGFRNTDISVLFSENEEQRTLPMRRTPRHRRAPRPARARALWWVELWDGWSAWAPWLFQASDLSSQQVRSWPLSQARAWAEQSAA